MSPLITTFAAWQDGAYVLMARVLGLAGTAITQATVSSITYSVGTLEGVGADQVYTPIIDAEALDKTAVISDTLLTTAPWTKDEVGRNVTITRPGTDFADPTARCRIEIWIYPTTGDQYAFPIVFEGKVNEIFGR